MSNKPSNINDMIIRREKDGIDSKHNSYFSETPCLPRQLDIHIITANAMVVAKCETEVYCSGGGGAVRQRRVYYCRSN